jgi:hypothetical protein
MIITIPFNSIYLKNKYKMDAKDIKRLTKEALPMLVERLSMDRRVEGIEVFSNIDLSLELGFSSKLKIIKSNTEKMNKPEDVILNYISKSQCKKEIIVIYNPLFPFISIKKIEILYQRVKNGFANSGVGSYFDAQGLCDENMVKISDRGIFAVINKMKFLQEGSRLISPLDTVGLSALELVSLRSEEDYELYGLIVNSGIV